MLPQRYSCNRIYSIVTELLYKVTIAQVCEKLSIKKALNCRKCGCLERLYNRRSRLSGLPNEANVLILQCRESIWLWKVFNELLRSSFPRNRTGVYSGKVRLDDAGICRWKRGVPWFVICFRPDTAVHWRKMYLPFGMKCTRSEWLLDRLSCVPRGDVN